MYRKLAVLLPEHDFVTIFKQMQSFNSKLKNEKRPLRENRLVTVGRVEDVPVGYGATVELANGTQLALYNVSGTFYAIENFCPHRGAPLADGKLCGYTVECGWHGWLFDVRTGACLTKADEAIESYQVIIEDELIKVMV